MTSNLSAQQFGNHRPKKEPHMINRAWAFSPDQKTSTLVEVGEKPLRFGDKLPDGRRVERQAWAYEYKAPYEPGRVELVGLTNYTPLPRASKSHASTPPPTEIAREAVKAARKAPKPKAQPVVSAPAPTLDEGTWRRDRLNAAINNPY